jgi:hypothetical protein
MAVRLPVLRARVPLPPGRFLVLISVTRLSRPQGHSAAGKVSSIEKIHLIWTRTRGFPACSIVLEPTTLLRDPINRNIRYKLALNERQKGTGYVTSHTSGSGFTGCCLRDSENGWQIQTHITVVLWRKCCDKCKWSINKKTRYWVIYCKVCLVNKRSQEETKI